MNFNEFFDHIKEGKPFIVYGDAMRFDPKKYPGKDPHDVYRRLIADAGLAINIKTEEEYRAHNQTSRLYLDETNPNCPKCGHIEPVLHCEHCGYNWPDRLVATMPTNEPCGLPGCEKFKEDDQNCIVCGFEPPSV